MTLGSKIASLRKEKCLTQEALAVKLNVSNQAVSKWEADHCCPDVMLLPLLADIFEVTLDELFDRAPSHQNFSFGCDLPWEDDKSLRAVLFVGRKLHTHRLLHTHAKDKQMITLEFHGTVDNIHSDYAVHCQDSVIQGSVHAGDGINCGDVQGNVTAGDGVNCGNVVGSVRAGDGVCCGNIGGSASAGDSIYCGNIDGNVTAGDNVTCAVIGGSVQADTVRMR